MTKSSCHVPLLAATLLVVLPGFLLVWAEYGRQILRTLGVPALPTRSSKARFPHDFTNNSLPEPEDCQTDFANGQQIAIAHTPRGVSLFALSVNSTIIYKYQLDHSAQMSDWQTLAGNKTLKFNGNPAVGVNKDGRIEVFFQAVANLDMWQIYQKDPKDPTSWSEVRESSCVDYAHGCRKDQFYWVESDAGSHGVPGTPVFSTSNPVVATNPMDGRLQLFFRCFQGDLFFLQQGK